MIKSTLIEFIIVAILFIIAINEYNSIRIAQIEIDAQYGQIENQIQRRTDLIPNLVATVKGYSKHEEQVLQEITEARTRITKASSPKEKDAANGTLTEALGRLTIVAENYPTLKADGHFKELMRELAGSENRIAVARRDYNEAIRNYSRTINTFPGIIIARLLGYRDIAPFTAEERAHTLPEVQF